MPGPIDINPDNIKPITDIAYKDKQGKWRAGPDANSKYVDSAGNVDPSYAKQATKTRRRTNLVKQIMRNNDISEQEARGDAKEMIQELEQAENDDERRDIRQQYINSP